MSYLYKFPPFFFTCVVVAVVLYLTLFPDPLPSTDIPLFEGADKIVHALMMMGVYMAVVLDMMRRDGKCCALSISACWWIFVMVSAFGGIVEIAQGLMDMGRGCDLMDFMADMAGALIGWGVSAIVPWRRILHGINHRP